MKELLFSVFIALLFMPTFAVCGACNNIRCNGKIIMLYPHGDIGEVYIEVDADKTTLNCTLKEDRFITLKETNMLFNETYALLLSSTLAERDVVLRIKEGTSDCELSYVQLIP